MTMDQLPRVDPVAIQHSLFIQITVGLPGARKREHLKWKDYD